jgi:hypothetical protein
MVFGRVCSFIFNNLDFLYGQLAADDAYGQLACAELRMKEAQYHLKGTTHTDDMENAMKEIGAAKWILSWHTDSTIEQLLGSLPCDVAAINKNIAELERAGQVNPDDVVGAPLPQMMPLIPLAALVSCLPSRVPDRTHEARLRFL